MIAAYIVTVMQNNTHICMKDKEKIVSIISEMKTIKMVRLGVRIKSNCHKRDLGL